MKLGIILLIFVAAFEVFLNRNIFPPDKLIYPGVSPRNPKIAARIPAIEEIFKGGHKQNALMPKQRIRTIIATGDVIPARSVNSRVLQVRDFKWPYLKTADFLKVADITFINLESPLIDNCPVTNKGMVFCGDSKNIEGLLYAGVDIANLANNHSGNYGFEALKSTAGLLNKSGIQVTGFDGVQVINVRGIKFGFLGFDDIGNPASEEKIKADIIEAKKRADVVVAAFHWGTEYKDQPDKRQVFLGHLAVDAGADLVIGNHPHWIQPVEIYKNKLITYAHGNFIFDQEWSLKTKQGVIGKYTFLDDKLTDVEFFPVLIEDYGQPRFLEGEEKNRILEDMKIQSERLMSG